MAKIFISHAWEDNENARKLAARLRNEGAEVWLYYSRIEIENQLPDVSQQAIEECDTFLLIWSRFAAASQCIKLEWKSALIRQKNIILCCFDSPTQSAGLQGFNSLDFSNFEQGYSRLVDLLSQPPHQNEVLLPEPEETTILPATNQSLRETPENLSETDVLTMIKKYDFFDLKRNESGLGFQHQLEIRHIQRKKVIYDPETKRIWQHGGSRESMWYQQAQNWIKRLNQIGYAGFNDWRLPTLEEAMSLMKNQPANNGLYLDPLFSKTQIWIWTADLSRNGSRAWVVFFNYGSCYVNLLDFNNYVRAVRSEK